MSIKIMNHVWEHADAKGTDLLMLLALADCANNDGQCYPRIDTLAHKIRCQKRNAQKVLRRLQENGEIIIEERSGTSHNYTVITDPAEKQRLKELWSQKKAQGDVLQYTPQDDEQTVEGDVLQYTPGVNHSTPEGVNHSTHKPYTIEPSLNQEQKESIISLPDPMYNKPIGPRPMMIDLLTPNRVAMYDKPIGPVPAISAIDTDKSEVFQAVHKHLGWTMNGTIVDDITDTIQEFGKDLVIQAVKKSAAYHPKSWDYIRTVIHSLKEQQDKTQGGQSLTVTPPPEKPAYVDWSKFPRKVSA